MELSNLKQWGSYIANAPIGMQSLFSYTFWILVFLTLVVQLVKIFTKPEIKTAYDFISFILSFIFNASKTAANAFANETQRALTLPRPYPRVARVVNRLVMFGMYVISFYMLIIGAGLFFAVLVFLHGTFIQSLTGIGFSLFILILGRYFFVQAEKLRLELRSIRP